MKNWILSVIALSVVLMGCTDKAGPSAQAAAADAAAAVGNDDLVDDIARDGADDLADRLLLIEGRNDHGNARACGWLRHHRLQRRPQLEQAGGGSSVSRARRKF